MPKTFLMCPPTFFDIAYEINDWMKLEDQVDPALALQQWQTIKRTYEELGHQIKLIEPIKGLPDMIFTANAGQVIDGKALVARFKYPQRQPETAHFERWFRDNGYDEVRVAQAVWEGEGDCLLAGDTLFAGSGFRSTVESHAQLAQFFGINVVGLRLVDPRFYHLDTCFCPLDECTIMYYPAAFDSDSRKKITQTGFDLIEAMEPDAAGFGLNAVSDGHNVVMSDHVTKLPEELRNRGFNPILVNVSEFKKSGGGVKCVTLELRN